MSVNRLQLQEIRTTKICMSTLIDWFSVLCVFLFSIYDCLNRLLPKLPISSLCMMVFIALLSVALLIKGRINQWALLFLVFIYLVIGISFFLSNGYQAEYIKTMLLQPLAATRLWVYFIVFSLIKQPEKWPKRLLIMGYINIALLAMTALTGKFTATDLAINYVGLGISASMWVPILIQHAFLSSGKARTVHIIGSTISIVFVAVYGNRGSLVAILVYVLYCYMKYTNAKRKMLIALLIGLLCFGVYTYQTKIITFIVAQVSKIGFSSRNLTLFLTGNATYTTHRTDEIWIRMLNAIKEKPLIGYGLCYDRVLNGAMNMYAHNLVLELMVSFGVPIGSILCLFHLLLGAKAIFGSIDDDWERLLTPFWVTSTVLLMFNNSFCQLGYFWISYGVFFAYKKLKCQNTKSTRVIRT